MPVHGVSWGVVRNRMGLFVAAADGRRMCASRVVAGPGRRWWWSAALAGCSLAVVGCAGAGVKGTPEAQPKVPEAELDAGPVSRADAGAADAQGAKRRGGGAGSAGLDGDQGTAGGRAGRGEAGRAEGMEPVLVRGIGLRGVSGDLVPAERLAGLGLGLPIVAVRGVGAGEGDGTWDGEPGEGMDAALEEGVPMEARQIRSMLESISRAYVRAGYGAVRVVVTADSLASLRDGSSDGVLWIDVVEGRIGSVRVRDGLGRDDASVMGRGPMLRHSPVASGDAVDVRTIDRYVDFLNRHPRRRVDAAVTPGDEPETVWLEYLVIQDRPWAVYGQLSNTGTEQTSDWKQQVGLAHFDLSGQTDVLLASYTTAGFDATHALSASYERPLWCSPRVRWRAFAQWSEYDASEVGLASLEFRGGSWGAGAEVSWNFFQQDALFLDAVAGVRYRRSWADGTLTNGRAETDFVLPRLGLVLERRRPMSLLRADVSLEGNADWLAGTDGDELGRMGRSDPSRSWVVARYSAGIEGYLDHWFSGKPVGDGLRASRIHGAAASVRGQLVIGDQRLPAIDTGVLGGAATVRGYREAIVGADNSVAGTLEYRLHLARGLAPSAEPAMVFGEPFRARPQYAGGYTDWDVVLRAFVEGGYAWHNDRLGFERDEALAGAGLGLEVRLGEHVTLRADWATPLRDVGEDEVGDSRLHVLLTIVY